MSRYPSGGNSTEWPLSITIRPVLLPKTVPAIVCACVPACTVSVTSEWYTVSSATSCEIAISRSRATIGALIRLSRSPVSAPKMPVSADATQSDPACPTAGPATAQCTRETWPPLSVCATSEPILSHNAVQGCSSGRCESVRSGALTTPETVLPENKLTNCSAISCATLPCASSVDAPRCGVEMTRGCLISAHSCSAGGSDSKTSRPAPATWPDSSAASSAASSMIPPRAQFTMRTPGLVVASESALIRLRVSSSSGTCTVKKSARRMHSAAETGSIASLREASSGNIGS
mmetsp:Transcript_167/g.548  ORF Transcript_167/g.548 Transcript_167/m.548 type:complete len:290 (-) Transcript_167:555-1424(-)